VITNLIDNALDAASSNVTVKTSAGPQEVVLEVFDDGGGIPEEQLSRIWEPFYTTKPLGVGTGIGLPISRKIIADHSGRIEVQSRPGLTVFEVHLPTAASKAPGHTDPADSGR
jgi:signal transduction histidine kinase